MRNISKSFNSSVSKISTHSNFLLVGRAAWSIFALLRLYKKEKKQTIVMPSFVCQSVIAAAVKANWCIKFLDIQIENGQISNKDYLMEINENIDAILFVHLLGNKNNIKDLQKKCNEKNILFIEDSAQYCSYNDNQENFDNSYVRLLSFGHSKIVDVGAGSLILSDDQSLIGEIEKLYKSYTFQEKKITDNFAKKFRSNFYNLKNTLPINFQNKFEFKALLDLYTPLIDTKTELKESTKENIIQKINNLDKNIERRRGNWQKYKSSFFNLPLIPLLNDYSVPWRASFRINGMNYRAQHELSENLRTLGYEVSNWYLPAHWYIDASDEMDTKLKNTLKLSQEIIQFWVDRDFDERYFSGLANVLRERI